MSKWSPCEILSSHKDKIQSNKRQGANYQIPCKDFNMVYVEETKRSFETRKKNILEISETLIQNPQISKITPQHFANTPLTCTTILTGTIAKFWNLKLIVENADLLNHFLLTTFQILWMIENLFHWHLCTLNWKTNTLFVCKKIELCEFRTRFLCLFPFAHVLKLLS